MVEALSALVVARNEGRRLAACLENLRFADEIVVVLDRCTDDSAAVAAAAGARVIEGAWPLEGARRNIGIEACRGPWIVEVDADERPDETLKKALRKAMEAQAAEYYPLRFLNYIGGRPVRYGWAFSFGVLQRLSLFRKGAKSWGLERVHPRVVFKGRRGAALEGFMHHYVDETVLETVARLGRYARARALDLHQSGAGGRETLGRNIRRFFTRFLQTYFQKQAYREGGYGLLVAACTALYPLVSYLRYRELCARKGTEAAADSEEAEIS